MGPTDLAAQWREEASVLRHRGAEVQAIALESCADELERALQEWQDELLTPEEAASETGYSSEQIRRQVRQGKLPVERGAGSRSHIRIRRGDLPRKPNRDSATSRDVPYDPIEDAHSIAQRLGGSHV